MRILDGRDRPEEPIRLIRRRWSRRRLQVSGSGVKPPASALRERRSARLVQLYLNRIKAYNGTCVNQPDGLLGTITPIKNAHQLNALITLNLRRATRERWGFDPRKARSMTDPADADPGMPDALEVAAKQDAYFASTGKLIGALHGVVRLSTRRTDQRL
jgi:hypothetical protein